MISKFKFVFFDAGGTLFHPFPSVGEIYREVAARYGCFAEAKHLDELFREAWLHRDGLSSLASHSDERVEKEWWKSLVEEIFTKVGGGLGDFENFFTELYELFGHPDAWRLYPEVFEVMEALKKQGKRTAIISNWDSRLFKLCDGLEMTPRMEFILASAAFGASKPSPKIFLEALKRAGVSPEEAVHVGDSFRDDIEGARGVGIHAVLVHRHGGAPRNFEKVPVIQSLRELL